MKNSINLLTNTQIVEKLLEKKKDAKIIITPIISLRDQLDICAFDLRLGTDFILYEKNIYTYIDPLIKMSKWDIYKTFRRTKRVTPLKSFVLHPGEQILGSTLEYISLPSNIFALLSGRSSWSRQGLAVHSTAEFIHPHTRGMLTLELQNNGPVPIKLYAGMRVVQLCFFELDRKYLKSDWKNPRYIDIFRTEVGKIWDDNEFDRIRSTKKDINKEKIREKLAFFLKDIDVEKGENLIREIEQIAWYILLQEEKL